MVSTDPRFAFGHSQLSREGLVAELLRQSVSRPSSTSMTCLRSASIRSSAEPVDGHAQLRTERVPGGRESASPPSAAANAQRTECWPYCGDRQGVQRCLVALRGGVLHRSNCRLDLVVSMWLNVLEPPKGGRRVSMKARRVDRETAESIAGIARRLVP